MLRPGGRHVFTVPLVPTRETTEDVSDRGWHHGRGTGVFRLVGPRGDMLVHTVFGRDLLVELRAVGFEAELHFPGRPRLRRLREEARRVSGDRREWEELAGGRSALGRARRSGEEGWPLGARGLSRHGRAGGGTRWNAQRRSAFRSGSTARSTSAAGSVGSRRPWRAGSARASVLDASRDDGRVRPEHRQLGPPLEFSRARGERAREPPGHLLRPRVVAARAAAPSAPRDRAGDRVVRVAAPRPVASRSSSFRTPPGRYTGSSSPGACTAPPEPPE